MRADKDDPRQVYENYADWLSLHPIWLLNVVLGYAYYLASTEVISRR